MPRTSNKVPSYKLHARTGHARAHYAGRDYWLGPYGSPESRELYSRLLRWINAGNVPDDWRAREPGTPPPADKPLGSDITVVKVLATFRRHARRSNVKDGRPTSEIASFRVVIRDTRKLYGLIPVPRLDVPKILYQILRARVGKQIPQLAAGAKPKRKHLAATQTRKGAGS